jgi:hypothetical protein
MGVRAKISARKIPSRSERTDQIGFFPIRSDHVIFKSGPIRSDIHILKCASDQIRSDHKMSDLIGYVIGYFLRTVKLIIQNYCFKSVFFIMIFHKRIILLLNSNYYVQKTDNLLSNQTLQIILIPHAQVLQIRRFLSRI